MKKITFLSLLLFAQVNYAQDKLTTAKGILSFEASVPFFEEVKAKNEELKCLLDIKTGRLYFMVYINQFQFKRDLMKEHFNNNYLESDRFPKALFNGVIENFDLKDITIAPKTYQIKGKIQIHGKSKKITVPVELKKAGRGIEIISNFTLNTDDFKIEIPSMVITKVSKNVNTHLECIIE